MKSHTRHSCIVSVKSFGDFIIPLGILERYGTVREKLGYSIAAGSHVTNLLGALGEIRTSVLLFSLKNATDIPDLYNAKRYGLKRSIKSAIEIRRNLSSLNRSGNHLIFPDAGLRKLIVSAGMRTSVIPLHLGNIYLSYCSVFGLSNAYRREGFIHPNRRLSIGVFPNSRVSSKTLPNDVLVKMVKTMEHYDGDVSVVLFHDETIDCKSKEISEMRIAKTFPALRDAVASFDLIVSSDSFPAHLAEFLGKPVFVVTPKANPFWLPLSSYMSDAWCTFASIERIGRWVRHFDMKNNNP